MTMATIRLNLCTISDLRPIGVWAKPEESTLLITIGNDTLEIWPADPFRIRELAAKLMEVAEQLED